MNRNSLFFVLGCCLPLCFGYLSASDFDSVTSLDACVTEFNSLYAAAGASNQTTSSQDVEFPDGTVVTGTLQKFSVDESTTTDQDYGERLYAEQEDDIYSSCLLRESDANTQIKLIQMENEEGVIGESRIAITLNTLSTSQRAFDHASVTDGNFFTVTADGKQLKVSFDEVTHNAASGVDFTALSDPDQNWAQDSATVESRVFNAEVNIEGQEMWFDLTLPPTGTRVEVREEKDVSSATLGWIAFTQVGGTDVPVFEIETACTETGTAAALDSCG